MGKLAPLSSDLELVSNNGYNDFHRSGRPWRFTLRDDDDPPWIFNLDWYPPDDTICPGKIRMLLTGRRGILEVGFKLNRLCYFGILVHESSRSPGKFYHVGCFCTDPEDPTSQNTDDQWFDKYPTQTIDII